MDVTPKEKNQVERNASITQCQGMQNRMPANCTSYLSLVLTADEKVQYVTREYIGLMTFLRTLLFWTTLFLAVPFIIHKILICGVKCISKDDRILTQKQSVRNSGTNDDIDRKPAENNSFEACQYSNRNKPVESGIDFLSDLQDSKDHGRGVSQELGFDKLSGSFESALPENGNKQVFSHI